MLEQPWHTARALRAAIWPAFFVAALGTRPARAAEPLRFHLDYVVDPAAKGCPDRAAFVHETEQLTAAGTLDANAERGIQALIERTPSGLRGVVSFEPSTLEARQSFAESSSHCSELASSMALALAMAIERLQQSEPELDVPSGTEPSPSASGAPERQAPASKASPPAPRASARASAAPTRLALATTANLGLAGGYTPDIGLLASAGFRVGARTRGMARSIELGVLSLHPGDAHGSREGRILLGLRAFTAQPCLGLVSWLDTCFSAMIGAHHARGSGVPNAREQEVFFMALGLRGVARAALVPGLDVRVRGGVDFPLTQSTFRLGEEAVYRVPIVAGLVEAGLFVHLP